MKKIKRIGIITAGGDAPGLNAAIRGVGKAALGDYGMEVVGFRDGYRGLAEDLRVRLDKPIHAVVALELTGVEDTTGVKEGGVLEQLTRELNIEALPTAIPESIVYELGEMEIGDTLTLDAIAAPDGVTLLDDPETTVASLSAPRLQTEEEAEIESETELVGEAAAGEAPAEDGGASSEE